MDVDITTSDTVDLKMVFSPYFQKCKTVILMNQQHQKIRSCNLVQFVGAVITTDTLNQ